MIDVTPRAVKRVAEYFKDKPKRPIRIFIRLGGCGIRTFGVALEDPTPSDEIFEIDGYQYIIDRKLLDHVKPIKFDSDGISFRLSGSGIHAPSGCGNCGYMCGVRGGNRCSGVCSSCGNKCAQGRRSETRKKIRA